MCTEIWTHYGGNAIDVSKMCPKPTINNYQVVGEASGAPEIPGHGPCPRLVQTNKHNGIVQGTKRRICAITFAFPWLIPSYHIYKPKILQKLLLELSSWYVLVQPGTWQRSLLGLIAQTLLILLWNIQPCIHHSLIISFFEACRLFRT